MDAVTNRLKDFTETIRNNPNLRHILIGLALVTIVYLGLLGFIFMKSEETLTWLQDRLTSRTVFVTEKEIEQRQAEKPEPVQKVQPTAIQPEPVTHAEQEHGPQTIQHEPIKTVDHSTVDHHEQHPATAEVPESEPKQTIPIKDLYEKSQYGMLPKIRVLDQVTPFEAYKKAVIPMGKPKIALVVQNFGLSQAASEMALERLPSDVSMLVSPYASNPDEWRKKGQAGGHETWLFMPFEQRNSAFQDPGPQSLLTTVSLKENETILKQNMGKAVGYPGVASATDYIFANSQMMLKPLVENIYNRGLGFLELNPNAPDLIRKLNTKDVAPYLKADVVINDSFDYRTKQGSPLKELERIARDNGQAIGVLYPHPNSLKQISVWLNSLDAKGFSLMPVSALSPVSTTISVTPIRVSNE